MATEELMDEREAEALFSLLERRLPAISGGDDDGEDASR
jgi:hypothetical protein